MEYKDMPVDKLLWNTRMYPGCVSASESAAELGRRLADAQATVEALQRERDEARRRVDELEAREVAVVLLRDELDAVREKAARLEAAYEKILLSRERLERELRGYPPVDNEGIPMVWQEPVGWVQRALNAATPENGVDSAG